MSKPEIVSSENQYFTWTVLAIKEARFVRKVNVHLRARNKGLKRKIENLEIQLTKSGQGSTTITEHGVEWEWRRYNINSFGTQKEFWQLKKNIYKKMWSWFFVVDHKNPLGILKRLPKLQMFEGRIRKRTSHSSFIACYETIEDDYLALVDAFRK